MQTNALSRIPESTNKAMITPLFQAYVVPPHCKASSKQTIPGRKTTVPKGSSFMICWRMVSVFLLGGALKMSRIAATTAPTGRFLRVVSAAANWVRGEI